MFVPWYSYYACLVKNYLDVCNSAVFNHLFNGQCIMFRFRVELSGVDIVIFTVFLI